MVRSGAHLLPALVLSGELGAPQPVWRELCPKLKLKPKPKPKPNARAQRPASWPAPWAAFSAQVCGRFRQAWPLASTQQARGEQWAPFACQLATRNCPKLRRRSERAWPAWASQARGARGCAKSTTLFPANWVARQPRHCLAPTTGLLDCCKAGLLEGWLAWRRTPEGPGASRAPQSAAIVVLGRRSKRGPPGTVARRPRALPGRRRLRRRRLEAAGPAACPAGHRRHARGPFIMGRRRCGRAARAPHCVRAAVWARLAGPVGAPLPWTVFRCTALHCTALDCTALSCIAVQHNSRRTSACAVRVQCKRRRLVLAHCKRTVSAMEAQWEHSASAMELQWKCSAWARKLQSESRAAKLARSPPTRPAKLATRAAKLARRAPVSAPAQSNHNDGPNNAAGARTRPQTCTRPSDASPGRLPPPARRPRTCRRAHGGRGASGGGGGRK